MKALLGIAGGFVLTLAVFASGLAFAAWLLAAKPVRQSTPTIGVAELWTKDVQPVDPNKQTLQRIPALQAASAMTAEPSKAGEGAQAAALPVPQTEPQPSDSLSAQPEAVVQPAVADQQLPTAHLRWCAARYRSYRPEENKYRAYSGEMRPCVSPYYDPAADRKASKGQVIQASDQGNDRQAAMAAYQVNDDQTAMEGYAATYGGPSEETSAQTEAALEQGRAASGDHVDYCFSRYRSYDPADNSYQPFDGGPRRQCE